MRRRLLWLISLRVAIVTVMLGAGVLAEIRARTSWTGEPFFLLLGVTYALSVVYALTLQHTERRRWLVDLQFGVDTGLVSALVLMTGGVTSFFSSLYALPILAASTVLDRQAGLLVGFLSSVLYMGVVLAQYTGAVGLTDGSAVAALLPPVGVALYTTGLGVFGFIAIAGLSGHLAERLHRADIRLERASTRIADLQAFNQDVIESLTCGLVTTDMGGQILTFNQSAERITRRTAADALCRNLSDILPLSDEIRDQLAVNTSESRQFKVVYTPPMGHSIEIAVTAAPLLTPAGEGARLFLLDDVTHARQLERESRLSQRLAAVGEMAAGLAHEIRNPLAAMSGSIQILRQELPLNAEQKKLMSIVLKESERLNDTISAFLAYARPRRGNTTRLDLARVVSETALLLRHDTEFSERHHLDVDVPSDPVWVEAGENQMRQVVWNLATNALRATPGGGSLRFTVGEVSDESVELSVSDDGVGIPADEVDRVFQPFQGRFGTGTGLGLAIVHRVVTDVGGDVRIRSEEGVGTTIAMRLPVRGATHVAPAYQESMD